MSVGIPMAPAKDLLAFYIQTFGAFHRLALYEYLSILGREFTSPSPPGLVLITQVA